MKLYVGNLSASIDDIQLRALAVPFGKPESANIARYLVGGASKGFGFVDYATRDEGRAAIAGLDGKNVDGQVLTVFESGEKARSWSGLMRGRA